MNYYTDGFKKMTDFKGCSSRKEYWLFFLINMIIISILAFFSALLYMEEVNTVYSVVEEPPMALILFIILCIYLIMLILPSISMTIRRLHDAGLSGWWYLVGLIPYVGTLFSLVLAVLPSKVENNKYLYVKEDANSN